jgi:hypothetical protein
VCLSRVEGLQQEAAAAANKRAAETKQGAQALVQQQQKMVQQQQQPQPKSYLSQFRNDKEEEGGHSQGSADLQLSQDDRLSQEAYAGVEGLDAALGDDKVDKQSQMAMLEASLKMIPDFEHDRFVFAVRV